jgi:hypothetical protein
MVLELQSSSSSPNMARVVYCLLSCVHSAVLHVQHINSNLQDNDNKNSGSSGSSGGSGLLKAEDMSMVWSQPSLRSLFLSLLQALQQGITLASEDDLLRGFTLDVEDGTLRTIIYSLLQVSEPLRSCVTY